MTHIKMTIDLKKERIFQHICTAIPVENWDEIKRKYQEIYKHKIEDFTPVTFNVKDLVREEKLGEFISVILEGRKYKKIALMYFPNEESFENFWNPLDDGLKSVIGLNTSIIE